MTTDNLSAQKLLTIPGGTDFNGLVQPGTYQQLWYDATAQNTPAGGNACRLAVSRIADNVILQTCTVWRGGLVYETYQRIREDRTWTAWDKLGPGEYHPGDSLQITTVSLPGWLTTNATNLYADICLPKPIGSDVTSATLSGGNVVARGITGYLMGGSTGGDPLDEQSFIVAINVHGVRVRFTRSGGYDGTNNTPVVSEIAGATLTFH